MAGIMMGTIICIYNQWVGMGAPVASQPASQQAGQPASQPASQQASQPVSLQASKPASQPARRGLAAGTMPQYLYIERDMCKADHNYKQLMTLNELILGIMPDTNGGEGGGGGASFLRGCHWSGGRWCQRWDNIAKCLKKVYIE
jgi:hypothetical protein